MGLFLFAFLYIILVIYIKVLIFILLISILYGCGNKDMESSILIGKVILIDPGHGGRDDGASYNGILEDEINLEIALMLQERLLEQGVYTLITRNADYDLSDMYSKNKKMKDLKERVKMINEYTVDLFISLHMNVYRDNSVSGAQVFYQNKNENSKKFAEILQKNLNEIQDKERKEMVGDYYILNNSNSVGVLVEMGFITSMEDMKKFDKKEYKFLLTNTIINSIKIYFCE